jgi:hypothetical protein
MSLAGAAAAGMNGAAVHAEYVLARAQRLAAQHAQSSPGDAGSL